MSATTLGFVALLSAGSAALYFAVGQKVLSRQRSNEAHGALVSFAMFWFTLAVLAVFSASTVVLAILDWLSPALYQAVTHLALAVLALGLGGLMYYLVYLWSGRRGTWKPIALFYLAYYLVLAYVVSLARPEGVETRRWGLQIDYAYALSPMVTAAVVGLLLVPPLVGAALYALLYFRVKVQPQRMRIGLVSLSILLWFGASLVARLAEVSATDGWQITSRFIGIGAASVVYFAFSPPGWVLRRLRAPAPA